MNQRTGEYPVREVVGNDANVPPVVVDEEPPVADEPSRESYVTVSELAVHCAYNVMLDVKEYDALFAYDTPDPFASVFHPSNVYPARVNALAVKFIDDEADCVAISPVPPFAS